MAMNQPPVGGMAGPSMAQGPGGGNQNQMTQQLRQMDHEELVMLTMQLITRVKQLQQAGQQTQGQPPQRQPAQGGQGQAPMR